MVSVKHPSAWTLTGRRIGGPRSHARKRSLFPSGAEQLATGLLRHHADARGPPHAHGHRRSSRVEPVGTEDVVESVEDGPDYIAPDRPPAEEE
jgi:hypothetical protein